MKYAYFFFALSLLSALFSVSSFAQFNKRLRHAEKSNSTIAEVKWTTKPAEFPGGIQKLSKYISKRTKMPKDAREHKVHGKVMVKFVIDSLGNIKKESVQVVQSLFESCDKEAVRVIQNCPRWMPAIDLKTNKRVESLYALPIYFFTKD